MPLHVTATGRALLSQMTPTDRSAALRRANFERLTPSTLMSVAAVDQEIQRSLERGWFEGDAEFTLDLGGVALPLTMPHRQFALLLAGPMFRVAERTEELVAAMKGEIERQAAHFK